jgi:NADPH2:quinone reductase
MLAARFSEFGGPVVVEDAEVPRPGPDEVRVRMTHVALNPLDIWVTRGTAGGGRQRLPFVIGTEGVGDGPDGPVIVHGAGVGVLRDGLLREVATVPADACHALLDGIERVQAAATGVAGVTAWRLVHDVARMRADDVALVLGAGGGVGSLLVQMLRATGCRVVAQTGSAAKADTLRELGATEVMVAEAADLPDLDPAPTVVFDPLGGQATVRAITLLAPFGRVALFGTSLAPTVELDLRALYRKAGSIRGYSGTIEPRERIEPALQRVLEAVRAGSLHVPIDSTVTLRDVPAALQRLLAREVQGKVVVEL